MSIDPVELAFGAVFGTTFEALYAGVEDLISKCHMFKTLFNEIKIQLDNLKPLLVDIISSNNQLSYANNEELSGIIQAIEAGESLISKCLHVTRWDLYRRYKYAKRLLAWREELDKQLKMLDVQQMRDVKKTAVLTETIKDTMEEVNQCMKDNFMNQDHTWCRELPELPEVIVGLEAPLKKLKMKLLGDYGVSMLVLTAPGGCGKTTLATMFCGDQEVKDVFGVNIYFVAVSKQYSLNSVVEQLYRQKSSQVPTFRNELEAAQALQEFLRNEGGKPLLLVLDDVWSGSDSLLEKFVRKMENLKILVTSRSEFRAFSPPCHLEILGTEDAMILFHHSASLGDKSSHIPSDLADKVANNCKGFPLALTVVGRSLRAQPIETWQDRLNQWPDKWSILDYETELLFSLQSSLEALDKERLIIKQCFLDLGSFPEDKRIPVDALIDMWCELYGIHDDTSCIAVLYELSNRSLAKLDVRFKGGKYYGQSNVTQHDLLRELVIYHSKLEPPEHRERLFVDICGSGNNFPKWCRKQIDQPMKARLVSISTDRESSTLKWSKMHMPETEVLVLNLRHTFEYTIPDFVEKMENLKVLLITYEAFEMECGLTNPQILSCLSNLKRIRLEGILLSSIVKHFTQLKSLKKLSLIRSSTFDVESIGCLAYAFPNLEEIYMQVCFSVNPLLQGLRNMMFLQKLTICESYFIDGCMPDEIGNLVNLEELRLMLSWVFKLPESIKYLKKLNTLCIFYCRSFTELPECIGEMTSLRKIDTRGCKNLKKLSSSVSDLRSLEEVTCDYCTISLWQKMLPNFKDKQKGGLVGIEPHNEIILCREDE